MITELELENRLLFKFKEAILGDKFLIGKKIFIAVPGGWVVEGTFVLDPTIQNDLRKRMDAIEHKLEALLDKEMS